MQGTELIAQHEKMVHGLASRLRRELGHGAAAVMKGAVQKGQGHADNVDVFANRPVDGVVVSGEAKVLIHRSAVTPQRLKTGASVLAGARVVEGALRVLGEFDGLRIAEPGE